MALAIALLSRADAMGLLPERITSINLEAMAGLEHGLADAGIGRSMVGELHRLEHMRRSEKAALLKKMVDALNESPAPAHEWRAVGDILGLELLSRLLGISASSARRYMSGARVTPDEVAGLEHGLADAGIGRSMVGELHRLEHMRRSEKAALLKKMVDALNESPAPAHEWRAVGDILGLELLSRLLGISASSARRYMSGARVTPDEVAVRLHFLAFVVGDLNGAYNEIGVRRWFDRQRALLDGGTPAGLLAGNWLPEHEGPRRVRRLAHSLAHIPAT